MIKMVRTQEALVVERFGKFSRVLTPGLNVLLPGVEHVRYRYSLKEQPVELADLLRFTKDNIRVHVTGLLFFPIDNPVRTSYGVNDYLTAVTLLAQTTLRSETGSTVGSSNR